MNHTMPLACLLALAAPLAAQTNAGFFLYGAGCNAQPVSACIA